MRAARGDRGAGASGGRHGHLPRSGRGTATTSRRRVGHRAHDRPGRAHPGAGAVLRADEALVGEVLAADTILLGLPLYNFGPPSSVNSWVDHLVARGLSIDAETGAGLLGGREFLVLAARGGGYGPGTPRDGWDHAEPWLPHGVSITGLEPRFITAELTLADVNPAMAELRPLAAESVAAAHAAIDELWTPVAA